jgi:hypothetical protein
MVEKHYGHLAESYVTEAIRARAPRYDVMPDETVVRLTPAVKQRAGVRPLLSPRAAPSLQAAQRAGQCIEAARLANAALADDHPLGAELLALYLFDRAL